MLVLLATACGSPTAATTAADVGSIFPSSPNRSVVGGSPDSALASSPTPSSAQWVAQGIDGLPMVPEDAPLACRVIVATTDESPWDPGPPDVAPRIGASVADPIVYTKPNAHVTAVENLAVGPQTLRGTANETGIADLTFFAGDSEPPNFVVEVQVTVSMGSESATCGNHWLPVDPATLDSGTGDACGSPANPYSLSFCGTGRYEYAPPTDVCSYFSCIASFWSGSGYMVECADGMVSMSGGRPGACSSHGGEGRPVRFTS